jgi:CBS domain-containing protein
MTEHGVKRLPVVRDGKLLGVVSRSDLLRAFARTDAEIERDIRENVVTRHFLLLPGTVTVDVRDGKVTLFGELERELEVELLPQAVQRVPGVVSVASGLRVRGRRKAGA